VLKPVKSLALSVCFLICVCALAEESAKPEDVALAARGAQALKQRMLDPDSLKISKVVVTTTTSPKSSVVEVCYEYRAKTKSGQLADRDMAVYSSAKGKETLKLGEELLHNTHFECNFNSRISGKTRSISSDITAVFNKVSVGENTPPAN
jgi:hypothetical protein